MIFTLPEAPSSNRYWRNVKGRMVLSADARAYRRAVEFAVLSQLRREARTRRSVRVEGEAVAFITWHRSIRSGDLDNRLKQTLDALKGLLFNDDAQFVAIYAQRMDSPRNGRMTVSVKPFDVYAF